MHEIKIRKIRKFTTVYQYTTNIIPHFFRVLCPPKGEYSPKENLENSVLVDVFEEKRNNVFAGKLTSSLSSFSRRKLPRYSTERCAYFCAGPPRSSFMIPARRCMSEWFSAAISRCRSSSIYERARSELSVKRISAIIIHARHMCIQSTRSRSRCMHLVSCMWTKIGSCTRSSKIE